MMFAKETIPVVQNPTNSLLTRTIQTNAITTHKHLQHPLTITLVLPHLFSKQQIFIHLSQPSCTHVSAPQLIVRVFAEVSRDGFSGWDLMTGELEKCVESCYLSLPEDDDAIGDGITLWKLQTNVLELRIKEGSFLDVVSKRWFDEFLQVPDRIQVDASLIPLSK